MNAEALLFKDNKFDYNVIAHVISVVHNLNKLLEECYRVLKPNSKIFILNHFRPSNWLNHIDFKFQNIAKQLHFKSVLYIYNLKAINNFVLLKAINIGRVSYFKLLIYSKL
jgi:phosphatidylethanolamine/phosphatidyl-N-methylethanolamine N-methyltransferase